GQDVPYFAIAMRLPVYKKSMPTASVEQRQAALIGSVGIAIDLEAMMDIAISKLSHPGRMHIALKDLGFADSQAAEVDNDQARLLYDLPSQHLIRSLPSSDGAAASFTHTAAFVVAGRQWELGFTSHPDLLMSAFDRHLDTLVLLLGVAASFLLCHLFHLPHFARRQALSLASEM